MMRVPAQIPDLLAEFVHGEAFIKSLQDGFGDRIDHSEFLELMPEEALVEKCWRNVIRCCHVTRGRIELDRSATINRARAKRDGRNMAFAGRAQAQNVAQRALR